MPAKRTKSPGEKLLRALPSVDETLKDPDVARLVGPAPRAVVVEAVRAAIAERRERLSSGAPRETEAPALASDVERRVRRWLRPSVRRAVNATGIVLHTGLGRAPLGPAAIEAIAREAAGYCVLEVDAETGARGRRDDHVKELLVGLTGAEDATVVNNNAAATLIILNTLASGRDVIISRGQLVEIGGSYRIPDVLEKSGATLVSVGTTNRTRAGDYERALSPRTAAILRVHPSNYRIVGFTEEASLEDLVAIGRKAGVPVIDDLGSGALVDLAPKGLAGEPLVSESVAAGADVSCFSGDKLIGGPQAGIIVGRAAVLGRIRSNALARALRVDKMTLAALAATLRLFVAGPEALAEGNPTVRAIMTPLERVRERAALLRSRVAALGAPIDARVVEATSSVGGGSLPLETLPTACVALRHRSLDADGLSEALRRADVPVFGRVKDEIVFLDLRTVGEGADEDAILAAIASVVPDGARGKKRP